MPPPPPSNSVLRIMSNACWFVSTLGLVRRSMIISGPGWTLRSSSSSSCRSSSSSRPSKPTYTSSAGSSGRYVCMVWCGGTGGAGQLGRRPLGQAGGKNKSPSFGLELSRCCRWTRASCFVAVPVSVCHDGDAVCEQRAFATSRPGDVHGRPSFRRRDACRSACRPRFHPGACRVSLSLLSGIGARDNLGIGWLSLEGWLAGVSKARSPFLVCLHHAGSLIFAGTSCDFILYGKPFPDPPTANTSSHRHVLQLKGSCLLLFFVAFPMLPE